MRAAASQEMEIATTTTTTLHNGGMSAVVMLLLLTFTTLVMAVYKQYTECQDYQSRQYGSDQSQNIRRGERFHTSWNSRFTAGAKFGVR
eukprot:4095984-Amphidinium_carterae.1